MTMAFNPSRLAQIFGPTPATPIAAGPSPALANIGAPPPAPTPQPAPAGGGGLFGIGTAPPLPPAPVVGPASMPANPFGQGGLSIAPGPGPAPAPTPATMAPNPLGAGASIAGGPTAPPTPPSGGLFGIDPSKIFGNVNAAVNNVVANPPPPNMQFAPMHAPTWSQAPPWAQPPGLVARDGWSPGAARPSPYRPWGSPAMSPTAIGGVQRASPQGALGGASIAAGPSPALGAFGGPTPAMRQPLPGASLAGGPSPALGALSDRRAKTNITKLGTVFGKGR